LEKDEIVRVARKNLVEGENWHKKVNVREIVFGFNDGSISTLALLAGVTGGALARDQILIARAGRNSRHGADRETAARFRQQTRTLKENFKKDAFLTCLY